MAPNDSNGAGNLARLRKMLAHHVESADALRKTLALLGDAAQESSARRMETTLAGALKMETERVATKKPKRRLAYSTPEETERRKQTVRTYLAREPLSSIRAIFGELHHRGVSVPSVAVLSKIINTDMPDVERVGEGTASRYRL